MTLGSTGGWRKEQSASNLQELLISDERGRGETCGAMQAGKLGFSVSSFCWGWHSQVDSGY